jgi:hypothetical protein
MGFFLEQALPWVGTLFITEFSLKRGYIVKICMTLVMLVASVAASSSGSYKGFLEYDHNDIEQFRKLVCEPDKTQTSEIITLEGIKVDKSVTPGRVIVALTGSVSSSPVRKFDVGGICGQEEDYYEGVIKKISENLNLTQYGDREFIVLGNRSCSKLALLFAASQFDFSVQHQHKVVLFGMPRFSDSNILRSVSEKVKMRSDLLMFDYYNLLSPNLSSYPGYLVEMTPRNLGSDAWHTSTTMKLLLPAQVLGLSTFSYSLTGVYNELGLIMQFLLSNTRSTTEIHFNSFRYTMAAVVSAVICYCGVRNMKRNSIFSEASVREAFLRLKESYLHPSSTLEEIGKLTIVQALRL